jgi:hypothetical protein
LHTPFCSSARIKTIQQIRTDAKLEWKQKVLTRAQEALENLPAAAFGTPGLNEKMVGDRNEKMALLFAENGILKRKSESTVPNGSVSACDLVGWAGYFKNAALEIPPPPPASPPLILHPHHRVSLCTQNATGMIKSLSVEQSPTKRQKAESVDVEGRADDL